MNLKEHYKEKLINLLEVLTPAERREKGLGQEDAERRAGRLESLRQTVLKHGFRSPKGANAAAILARAGIDVRAGGEAFGTEHIPVNPEDHTAGTVLTLGRRSGPDGSGFSVHPAQIGPYTGRDVDRDGPLANKAVDAHRAATMSPEEIEDLKRHNRHLEAEFGLGPSPSLPGASESPRSGKINISDIIARRNRQ